MPPMRLRSGASRAQEKSRELGGSRDNQAGNFSRRSGEAAAIVLQANLRLILIPLDVTRRVRATRAFDNVQKREVPFSGFDLAGPEMAFVAEVAARTVVDSPAGRLGTVICWENYMPMLRQAMYAQGIEIYCAPTVDDRDVWQHTMRHIALEGRCFVLAACQYACRADYPDDYASVLPAGDADEPLIRGGSVIVDPLGEVLAGPVYGRECVLLADVDLDRRVRSHLDLDVVGHYARPDVFQLLVDDTAKSPVTFTSRSAPPPRA